VAIVYLGLGSNLGNRENNIRMAIQRLEDNAIHLREMSSLIETDPVGGPPQDKFLNAVIKATTDHPPENLLDHLKTIERQLGRTETVRNGPRTIDLDILFYDDLRIETPRLTIPHPRMKEREFVMKPLAEIDPDLARKFRP
jgi:2-amino-4-hydroxy-6-hydroxymethyldihydropteridine diphosphokinase